MSRALAGLALLATVFAAPSWAYAQRSGEADGATSAAGAGPEAGGGASSADASGPNAQDDAAGEARDASDPPADQAQDASGSDAETADQQGEQQPGDDRAADEQPGDEAQDASAGDAETADQQDEQHTGDESQGIEPESALSEGIEPESEGGEAHTRRERDLHPASSDASSVLGTTTVLSGIGTLISLAFAVERADIVGQCDGFARETAPTRGCLNEGVVRTERNIAIGLTIGLGVVAVGAGVAWLLVVLGSSHDEDEDDDPTEARVTCAPGLLSIGCAGRF